MMADERKTPAAPGSDENTVPDARPPQDPALRIYLRQLTRFGVTGLVNLAIDLCLFSILLYLLDVHLILANTLAYLAGVTNSFLMNRSWTFGHTKDQAPMSRKFPLFLFFNLIGLGLSNLTVWLLASALTPMGAKCVSVVVTYVWNFTTSRRYVFSSVKS